MRSSQLFVPLDNAGLFLGFRLVRRLEIRRIHCDALLKADRRRLLNQGVKWCSGG